MQSPLNHKRERERRIIPSMHSEKWLHYIPLAIGLIALTASLYLIWIVK